MERKTGESPFSPRARKLLGRAFKLGIDPQHIMAEGQRAIDVVQKEGRARVTRGDLTGLVAEVRSIIDAQRFGPEVVEPSTDSRPLNPDGFWNT